MYSSDWGLYKGCVAYQHFYKKKIFVFKDVSPKRLKERNVISKWSHYKVQYVSNAQLLKMDYFHDIKAVVFDGKLGTDTAPLLPQVHTFFASAKMGLNPHPVHVGKCMGFFC